MSTIAHTLPLKDFNIEVSEPCSSQFTKASSYGLRQNMF